MHGTARSEWVDSISVGSTSEHCRNRFVVPLRSILLVTACFCQPPTASLDERLSSGAWEIGYIPEQRYSMDTMSHARTSRDDPVDGALVRPSNGTLLADLPASLQANGNGESSKQPPVLPRAHNEDFRGPAIELLSPGPLARRSAALHKLFHELGQGLRDAALAGADSWARTDLVWSLRQANPTHRRLACKPGADGGHRAEMKSLLWREEARRNAGALPDRRQCGRGALRQL